MIAASLELAVRALFYRTGDLVRLKPLPGLGWQIRSLAYLYFPSVDDEALEACRNLESRGRVFTVITPPGREFLFRQALRATLDERSPTVFSLDGFISWRIMFAAIDLKLTHDATLRELLARYNRRVVANGNCTSILVKVPRAVQTGSQSKSLR
jgi:hypothetical protein